MAKRIIFDHKMRRLSATVSNRQFEALGKHARRLGITKSEVLRRVLDQGLDLWRKDDQDDGNSNSDKEPDKSTVALLHGDEPRERETAGTRR